MPNHQSPRKKAEGVAPPPELVAAVKDLVAEGSEKTAAKVLGIGAGTVARLKGGLPCRPGTIELARLRLAARAS